MNMLGLLLRDLEILPFVLHFFKPEVHGVFSDIPPFLVGSQPLFYAVVPLNDYLESRGITHKAVEHICCDVVSTVMEPEFGALVTEQKTISHVDHVDLP